MMHVIKASDTLKVAGHTFMASLPAVQCKNCDETYFDPDVLARFELAVAALLAQKGTNSSEALRFMRKAINLRAAELADLLDVAPETVSRWETGKLPVERRALALLGSLVIDKAENRTSTLERLRELREPKPFDSIVRLDLPLAAQ